MITMPRKLSLISLALAASMQLAACGGGSAGAPDIFPPTVLITADAAGTVTGPVTFTFTFNEDVGSSFTADDILVTGGTPGPLTRVSATVYQLVVTPPESAAGTIQVTVASESFTDAVGNVNTVNPTAALVFNTGVVGTSGNTGTCTDPCIDFASASVGYLPFEGLVSAAQANDPNDAANKVAMVVKGPSGQPWAGVTIYTNAGDQSVAAINFATSKVITLRVYAPAAGMKITLKVENAANPGVNMLKTVLTTQANTWETLSFDFTTPTQGTYNPAEIYNKVSLFPLFDPTDPSPLAPTSNTTFYFDELKPAAGGDGAGGGGSDLTFPITFEAATNPTVTEFGGAGYVADQPGPAGGTGNALKIIRNGGDVFAGVWITIPAIPNNAGPQTISALVYSPTAGIPFVAKAEFGDNQGTDDVPANETVVAGWQTLTWTFTSFDATKVYNRFTILPNLGTVDSNKEYYVDDIKLVGGGGGGGGAATFSDGFATGGLTANGGAFGGFSGSNQDGFNCSGDPAWCGSGGNFTGDASSAYYYYYQTPTPATALYMGMYILAPGVTDFNNEGDTAGVSVGSTTNLKFKLGQNAEWFGSATNNFMIVVDLGKRYVAGGGTCRLQLRNVTTPTAAAATAYSIPWTAFDLVQNCGQSLSVAQALAASPVSQISFQGVGGTIALTAQGKTSGANLSVAAGELYPTTLVVEGPITFE